MPLFFLADFDSGPREVIGIGMALSQRCAMTRRPSGLRMRGSNYWVFDCILMACQIESLDLPGHRLFSLVARSTAPTGYFDPDTTRLFVTEKTFETPFA